MFVEEYVKEYKKNKDINDKQKKIENTKIAMENLVLIIGKDLIKEVISANTNDNRNRITFILKGCYPITIKKYRNVDKAVADYIQYEVCGGLEYDSLNEALEHAIIPKNWFVRIKNKIKNRFNTYDHVSDY